MCIGSDGNFLEDLFEELFGSSLLWLDLITASNTGVTGSRFPAKPVICRGTT